ncbi:hypothetical protein [Pollutibacter soli]|uniref:hypothetical protein n=1 Tax=Pollutibacter soli TaxID=3034157 RepID=UPI003013D533
MISRLIFSVLIFLIVFTSSCGSGTDKKIIENTSDSSQSESPAIESSAKKVLDLETAETIVANYYADLNRAAGYTRYKGLGLKILDIKAEQDSSVYLVYSENTGRISIRNTDDTTSASFSEKLTLKASFLNNNWEAEPLP